MHQAYFTHVLALSPPPPSRLPIPLIGVAPQECIIFHYWCRPQSELEVNLSSKNEDDGLSAVGWLSLDLSFSLFRYRSSVWQTDGRTEL